MEYYWGRYCLDNNIALSLMIIHEQFSRNGWKLLDAMLTLSQSLKHKRKVLFASLIIERVPDPPIKYKAGTKLLKIGFIRGNQSYYYTIVIVQKLNIWQCV